MNVFGTFDIEDLKHKILIKNVILDMSLIEPESLM
jgi:hypothetical protein